MDIWTAIKNRRSIRNFTVDPVEELEKIQEKIETGKYKVIEVILNSAHFKMISFSTL
jgi:nitroreductase